MPRQFPEDDSAANAGAVVHVWVASISEAECTSCAETLSSLMQETLADLPGFLEGQVLEADDRQSVIILTHWASRHIWAQAQWNEEVGRTLYDLFRSGAKMVDTMYYVRSVVRPAT